MKKHLGLHHMNSWKSFALIFLVLVFGGVGFVYSFETYPQLFRTEVSLEKKSDIFFDEPVEIIFSLPVATQEYSAGIEISPFQKTQFRWSDDKKKLSIIPENYWQPQTRYEISLPSGRNAYLSKVEEKSFSFSTTAYPKIKKITPENGAKEVTLDIEDPIIIDFDKSTAGFYIKFILDPDSPLAVENNPEKTQFRLLPKVGMKDGQKYDLKLLIKYKGATEDEYFQAYSGSFETLLLVPVVWEKDYALRLEQAKKYTRPKITEGKFIDINLENQIMTIFENGNILDAYLVSSGKRGMETPKGDYQIRNKAPKPWSKAYGLYMPHWMALVSDGKFGIHELPEWPGGYKEGAAHLGIPVSHGCVRLGVGPASRVYDWAEIGTPVTVH